ncbi:hypothetical protein KCP76_06435 [Salmonella enterica subsp. enterica serovar Weltevreden]|nr:hypothetical protein KCP76_06435 [Salmonella enterica subsp. enterica serovar Weltevreden]
MRKSSHAHSRQLDELLRAMVGRNGKPQRACWLKNVFNWPLSLPIAAMRKALQKRSKALNGARRTEILLQLS